MSGLEREAQALDRNVDEAVALIDRLRANLAAAERRRVEAERRHATAVVQLGKARGEQDRLAAALTVLSWEMCPMDGRALRDALGVRP